MVTTPNFDLDIDTTLGGNNASDYVIPSQKAIKSYVDNNSGSTVDQTYDPTSQAAQSGVAIAGELTKYVDKTSTQNISADKTFNNSSKLSFYNSASIYCGSGCGRHNITDFWFRGQNTYFNYPRSITNEDTGIYIHKQGLTQKTNFGIDGNLLYDATSGLVPYQRLNGVTDNNSGSLKFWSGTQAEFEQISTYYCFKSDTYLIYTTTPNPDVGDEIFSVTVNQGEITDETSLGYIISDTSVEGYTINNNHDRITYYGGYGSGHWRYYTYNDSYNINRLSEDTLYNVEDTTSPIVSILDSLYPVGAIYIGTMNACPLQTLGIGTWQLVAQDRVLQGAGSRGAVGTTINESLPAMNIVNTGVLTADYGLTKTSGYKDRVMVTSASGQAHYEQPSTYQDGAPVQPDGYLVNIWERTA